MMRFGVKSLTHEPPRWIEEVLQMPPGFDGFTLDCPYPLPEISASVVRELRMIGLKRGITYLVHMPAMIIALGDLDTTVRHNSIEEVRRAIALAKQINAALITIHPTPCRDSEQGSLAQRERLQRDALNEICADAEGQGVVVAIENMPPRNVYAPAYSSFEGLFVLLEEIGTLGVTLDVGHANMAGVSLCAVVPRLGRRLCHIHIHDNDGSADQHLPVGRGTVDWHGLIQSLSLSGYAGLLEMEFQGEAALLTSKRYLERLFQRRMSLR